MPIPRPCFSGKTISLPIYSVSPSSCALTEPMMTPASSTAFRIVPCAYSCSRSARVCVNGGIPSLPSNFASLRNARYCNARITPRSSGCAFRILKTKFLPKRKPKREYNPKFMKIKPKYRFFCANPRQDSLAVHPLTPLFSPYRPDAPDCRRRHASVQNFPSSAIMVKPRRLRYPCPHETHCGEGHRNERIARHPQPERLFQNRRFHPW